MIKLVFGCKLKGDKEGRRSEKEAIIITKADRLSRKVSVGSGWMVTSVLKGAADRERVEDAAHIKKDNGAERETRTKNQSISFEGGS